MSSFASSYIPTGAASVTRNADVLTYPTTGWLNASAGTLYGQATQIGTLANAMIASIDDGTGDNRIEVRYNSTTTTQARFNILAATVLQAQLIGGTFSDLSTRTSALAYASNDAAGYTDGTQIGTDTSVTVPTVSQIRIGVGSFSESELFGPIRRVQFYNARLANADLQALTSG